MKNNVGYRIKKLREARDFSRGQVAQELGITPGAYYKIERGETDPSVGRLEQIAAILKVNITDFFTDPQVQVTVDPSILQGFENRFNSITREVAEL
ncbi:MAG TPA: helix-turn-helix transcriptional regulator, partial [Chitinophagaceae bacterium]|nr:helix-turn-helix transcriptional regulator [Chitinophagaceae bacterium]